MASRGEIAHKVEDAANPEKLAGKEHHKDGEEEQEIEGTRLRPNWG